MIATFDRRTLGVSDAAAWASVLPPDMTLDIAQAAVRQHFSTSEEYLMPVHVIRLVRQLHRDRVRDAPVMLLPMDLTLGQEQQWIGYFYGAVKAAVENPQMTADEAMGVVRVETSPPVRRVVGGETRNQGVQSLKAVLDEEVPRLRRNV